MVIVGGGFAGLACARTLGAAGVETVLVDRHNDHVFVALLDQVAIWLPAGARLGNCEGAPLIEASFFACRPTLCSAGATVAA